MKLRNKGIVKGRWASWGCSIFLFAVMCLLLCLSIPGYAYAAEVSVDCPAVSDGQNAVATATIQDFPEEETISYSWWYSKDEGSTWSNAATSSTSASFSTLATDVTAGYLWKLEAVEGETRAETQFWVSVIHQGETFSVSYDDAESGVSGSITYQIVTDSQNGNDGEALLLDASGYAATASSPELELGTVFNTLSGRSYSITGVNRDAFKDNVNIYAVKFTKDLTTYSIEAEGDEGIAAVGPHAFDGCSNLTSVTFACKEIWGLGTYAFANCTALSSVTFDDSLSIPSVGISAYVFSGCTSLKQIRIPALTVAKRKGDYYGWYGSDEVRFFSGYQAYWHNTLYCIARAGLSDYAFTGCTGLESIAFDSGNDYGLFAYYLYDGCGLRYLPHLQNVIYEATQPYFGNPDQSMANGSYYELWGDSTDSDGNVTKGVNPTFYYAVDYYYNYATLKSDSAYANNRLARVEYKRGTSISDIQAGDAEALADSTADRALYAEKDADGIVPDPNVAAREAQELGISGFSNADQYQWVWYLRKSQSRHSGLTDSCNAYLMRADSLQAGRVEAVDSEANQIESMYRVCAQNLSQGSIGNTAFGVAYYYDLIYSDYFVTEERNLVHKISSDATPWFTLDAGGLSTLAQRMTFYDGAGNKVDITDSDKFTVYYQKYNTTTYRYDTIDINTEIDEAMPLIMVVAAKDGSGYTSTFKEWLLVKPHSGSILEQYTSDSGSTWRNAIYSNAESSKISDAREKYSTDEGFAVCASSGDATSALTAASYAGLSKGAINITSSEAGYGFGLALASSGSYISSGEVTNTSDLKKFPSGSVSPSSYSAACYKSFESRKADLGLSDYKWGNTALLVNPAYVEDAAAAAASYAYSQGAPIFYTEADGSITSSVLTYLQFFSNVVIVGDEEMVPESTREKVKNYLGASDDEVKRLDGDANGSSTEGNACSLSIAMADYLTSLESGSNSFFSVAIVVASGSDMVSDVVGALNFSGHENGITLVVSTSADAKTVAQYLRSHQDEINDIRLYGRGSDASNTDSFDFLDSLSETWTASADDVASVDSSDAVEIYGEKFNSDDSRSLSGASRIWGSTEIEAGSYIERDTDGSALTYTLSSSVPVPSGYVEKPTAESGLVYNGSAQIGVKPNAGYTVSGEVSETDAGTYTAHVKLNTGYVWSDRSSDEFDITWSIEKASMAKSLVSLESSSCNWANGNEISPKVASVTLDTGITVRNETFTYKYYRDEVVEGNQVSSIRDVGTYIVVVTGTKNLTGSASAVFEVTPLKIYKPKVADDITYDGSAHTGVTVYDAYNRYCEITGQVTGTNAGTYTVTVTPNAGYAWMDGSEGSYETTWTIAPKSLSGATVELSSNSESYTGSDLKPSVESISLEGGPEITIADYDVSYWVDGIEVKDCCNVGSYRVRITGKNNFTGTVEATFEIQSREVAVPDSQVLTYSGVEQQAYRENGQYKVITGGSATDAGLYSAELSLKDGNVWEDGTYENKKVAWSIQAATIVSVGLSNDNIEYTGGNLAPSLTFATDSGACPAIQGEDYDVTYYQGSISDDSKVSAITEVGKYVIVIEGRGNYTGTVTKNFEVTPIVVAPPSIENGLVKDGLVYNGTLQSGVEATEDFVVSGDAACKDAGSYTAIVKLEKGRCWSDGSVSDLSIGWSIAPGVIDERTVVSLAATSRDYTGEALDFSILSVVDEGVSVETEDREAVYYKEQIDAEHIVNADEIKSSGHYYVVVTGVKNFTGSVVAEFDVNAAAVDVPTAAVGLVYNGNEQTGIEPNSAYTVESGSGVNAKDYTATVTLNDGYVWTGGIEGPQAIEWSIAPSDISEGSLSLPEPQTYTGEDLAPQINVKDNNGLGLSEGDYQVLYYRESIAKENFVSSPRDAGDYVVVVRGQGNFTGTISSTTSWTINRASLEGGESAFELENSSTKYNGAAQALAIKTLRSSNGVSLLGGKGYEVTYYRGSVAPENVVSAVEDAGEYVVVVTGTDNFCGTAEATWSVTSASLDDATINLAAAEVDYTGESQSPVITSVSFESGGVAKESDYEVRYYRGATEVTDFTAPGEYTITISGKEGGNCTGTARTSYTVLPKGTVAIPTAVSGLVYNGNEQTGVAASAGYTVVGGTGTEAGSYTATVKLKSGYQWSDKTTKTLSISWTIAKAKITPDLIELSSYSATYTGKDQLPEVTSVKLGDVVLGEGQDYEVTYYNKGVAEPDNVVTKAIAADDYIVRVSGLGKNFEGDADIFWKMNPISLSDDGVVLSAPHQTYNGEPLSFTVKSVTADGFSLSEGVDYRVSYFRGIAPVGEEISKGEIVDVGEYYLVVEGLGNFASSVTKSFSVDCAKVDTPKGSDLEYSGSAQSGVVDGAGYTVVSGGSAIDVGSYEATVRLKYGYEWSDGSDGDKEVSWSIVKASIEKADVQLDSLSQTYAKTPWKPAVVSAHLGDSSLVEGEDYSLAYYKDEVAAGNKVEALTDVGSYIVLLSGIGDNFTGEKQIGVSVTAVVVEVPKAVEGLVYNASEQTGVNAGEGYILSGNVEKKAGSYTATATLEDGYCWTGNDFEPVEIPWSIAQAEISSVSIASSKVIFDPVRSIVPDLTVMSGSTAVLSGDYTETYYLGEASEENKVDKIKSDGTFTIVITGKRNYTGEKTVQLTVLPIAIDKPVAESGLVYTGKTLTGVAAGTGYAVESGSAVNAGAYTATVTPNTGYEWEDHSREPVEISWSISSQSVAGATLTLSSTSGAYTGQPITPEVSSLKLSDGTKLKSSDYDIAYYKGSVSDANKVSGSPVAVGNYIVVATLKGNYSGTCTASFAITGSSSDDDDDDDDDDGSYDDDSSYDDSDDYDYSDDDYSSDDLPAAATSTSGLASAAGSKGSTSLSGATADANGHSVDSNGWTIFQSPGTASALGVDEGASSSASLFSNFSSLTPWAWILVLVCLLALGGSVLYVAKSSKETDDLLEAESTLDE